MHDCGRFDRRFFEAALDCLKSFRQREFTARFLAAHDDLPDPGRMTFEQTWAAIATWMGACSARCKALLEYVDRLRMWGRQCIFLFEIDQSYVEELTGTAQALRDGAFKQPVYTWDASEPLLVEVRREGDLLVFKLVELRKFDVVENGVLNTHEERSTNFFIVNLRGRYAELRLQILPTGARRDIKDERARFMQEIGKYVNLGRLSAIRLRPAITDIGRRPNYETTGMELGASDTSSAGPNLLAPVVKFFRGEVPSVVRGYWDCDQGILGQQRRLYFAINGRADYVRISGLADPARVRELLDEIVAISREPSLPPPDEPLHKRGLVDRPLAELKGQPAAQVVVLSAAALAASMLWVLIQGVAGHVSDEALQKLIEPVPLVAITLTAEIVCNYWLFYGSRRVRRSFRAFLRLKPREMWRELMAARKREQTGVHVSANSRCDWPSMR
jgi:hypothetical protein